MYRIGEEEINAVARVIRSGNMFKINDGLQEVRHFEEELKEKFATENAILMTSGKAALISALVGLGIGPGDQVIVPAYTYIATAIAVTAVGAIPVIAEVDETLTIDPADMEKKLTEHTKAIIPVHIQGFPCKLDAICEIAKKHGIAVVEDACQSVGGSYHGKRLGTVGEAGALSFNQFKIISAGEAGALMTNDGTVFNRALIYHDSSAIAYFGNQLEGNGEEQFCGSEFRSNEITAAILREQLKRLDGIIADLRRNRKKIIDGLKDKYTFIPSNDDNGDCGTTVAFRFESEEKTRRFAQMSPVGLCIPIETGKHIYCNWTAIMNKKGAFHEGIDPFKMDANSKIVPDYNTDMCPKTLDLLKRTAYLSVSPDWSDEEISDIINKYIDLKEKL
ncbi:MAG: DegT/DnrJ/EryC1/StrS family aminotransferase [Clostridia bacterium]|nr:DegT/DnrJ/EryC1/StrS family aminotransferase [Clostridia bacterium]